MKLTILRTDPFSTFFSPLSLERVLGLVAANTDSPDLGFLGEPGVNVLRLNLALDELAGR